MLVSWPIQTKSRKEKETSTVPLLILVRSPRILTDLYGVVIRVTLLVTFDSTLPQYSFNRSFGWGDGLIPLTLNIPVISALLAGKLSDLYGSHLLNAVFFIPPVTGRSQFRPEHCFLTLHGLSFFVFSSYPPPYNPFTKFIEDIGTDLTNEPPGFVSNFCTHPHRSRPLTSCRQHRQSSDQVYSGTTAPRPQVVSLTAHPAPQPPAALSLAILDQFRVRAERLDVFLLRVWEWLGLR